MIDLTNEVVFDDLPRILAWRDTEDPDLIYACPQAPGITVGDDGKPQLSLIVYARKTDDGSIEYQGGYASAAVELALAAEDTARLVERLNAPEPAADDEPKPDHVEQAGPAEKPDEGDGSGDLGSPEPGGPAAPPAPREIRVVDPPWIDAALRLSLIDGEEAEGKPSLIGRNQCVLQWQFDAQGVGRVLAAWRDGLPDAEATYFGTLPLLSTTKRTLVSSSKEEETGEGVEVRSDTRFELHIEQTERDIASLCLRGGLRVDKEVLETLAQVIAY